MSEKIEKLVDIVYGNYNQNLSRLSEVLIAINPDATDYAEKVQEILSKHLSFEFLKPKLAEIYERILSDEDADTIITFYLSDAGKKLLEHQIDIATEVSRLNQKILAEKQDLIGQELNEWIENESNKRKNNFNI